MRRNKTAPKSQQKKSSASPKQDQADNIKIDTKGIAVVENTGPAVIEGPVTIRNNLYGKPLGCKRTSIFGRDSSIINEFSQTTNTNTVTFNNIAFAGNAITSENTAMPDGEVTIVHMNNSFQIWHGANTNINIVNCTFDTDTSTNSGIIFHPYNTDVSFTVTGNTYGNFFETVHIGNSKEDKLKKKIREQLAPAIINHRGDRVRALQHGARFEDTKENELVALQLLRQMVAPDVFKKYLKYGFITVEGPSGLTYQIQRKSHLISVWENGRKLNTLCVYLQDQSIPPTDEVVAKMLICQYDERDIWDRANIGWRDHKAAANSETLKLLGIKRPDPKSNICLGNTGGIRLVA